VLLSDGSETLGLNVYSTVADSLEDVEGVVELFAIYVRAILGHAHEAEHWVKALDSRTLIGQATGILMAGYQLSPAAAFDFLVRMSQTTNTKLRAIAAEIVQTAADKA
jgi:AmiR/NasT family two-component response regulator